ncbi:MULTISPECIES: M1 family aminopeptidase [Maribacter]|uniref:M1 family aminopeptidase n=1 Tax=Maribacter flavus TaxID=1658664 RepID=A0ABU7IGK0_9FLAO|nr:MULTISPECIES: M1 family aminopeptidase [Maribacter]MDC6404650.1 M1 family aminopeptidase [Maribacter sp. PR66]MEE1972064.1 M1 family aminopeptidase [Maribacter flavus]
MNAIFQYELNQITRRWAVYPMFLLFVLLGIFSGNKFNMTAGEGIYLNSPYTIGFMMGIFSLSMIFLAILYSNQILFKEWDAKFDLVIFSLPFSKLTYLTGKFWFFYLKTFLSFSLLILGFVIGQNLRTGDEMQMGLNLWYYVYPLLVFGILNALFVCSFLFFIAYSTHKKLVVVIGGLLLYVLYMVLLVFSNSPFMSGSMPQSIEVQQISAILDPFGLSAYFFEARSFSVLQKNNGIVPLTKMFLLNRGIFLFISLFFLWSSYRVFSFSRKQSQKSKKNIKVNAINTVVNIKSIKTPKLNFGSIMDFKSALSFTKLDLIYLFKSVVIAAVSLLLVFYIGMEMYADIDKGIRLPEKYATSGLLATSISSNFHLFGVLILAYFVNDLYWRSHASNFALIEKSIYFSKSKLKGHFISSIVLVCFFTIVLIVEALIFQFSYGYFSIDWKAYLGVFIFNAIPLILFSAFLLLINDTINNRYVSLGVSTVSVFALASPLLKYIISYPLLHIFSGYNGIYSDFNGYGIYLSAFSQRLFFGLGFIAFIWLINSFIKTKVINKKTSVLVLVLLIVGATSGIFFMKSYMPKNEEQTILEAVNYEKSYRKYEAIPQPTITDVTTDIHLYPSKNAYEISGHYVLSNQTNEAIHKVLVNFHPDLEIETALFESGFEKTQIEEHVTEISLDKPLQPNEEANLTFSLSYKWFAVNGHQSFNAIVNNGSFMRISNYYPTFGYQNDREIDNVEIRAEFNLGKASELKALESPQVFKNDFINLEMNISTEKSQTAIGTGDLIKQWTANNRNYYKYSAENVPFRFALASAEYEHKSIQHKDKTINVYYSKKHFDNVDYLIKNAKITLDYCIDNFGEYPFKTISFVEISAFTKGFAATAYPSTIFMTEDMIFHTNLEGNKKQDVINELAGHELSHLWWGNSQINPDYREGASMLTETLAMYTEMMLYKKMHGHEKMKERLEIHQQIYDNEKGLYDNQPLSKVKPGYTHIAYSKGAIAMVKLSELIGEQQVNQALKNFLKNNQYPKKPTSLDLLEEFYKVAPDESAKSKIDELFKSM